MKIVQRISETNILQACSENKVLLLFGTRRVGKTFLLQQIVDKYSGKHLVLNGEDMLVQDLFKNRNITHFQRLTGDATLLVIDEAQAIPEIGKALKLMIDTQPQLTILASGSSSLDLASSSGEPLTGRNISFFLYPFSIQELRYNALELNQNLHERLVFGAYPEVFQKSSYEEKAIYLSELVQSYLLKDILSFSGIRHSEKIYSLLRLIAYQTGSEVSYQEISNKLGISKITVENYLDLLSKVFILYKLPAFNTNQRNEISKGVKWYFYDNGIRNAVINDFRLPPMRNDMGALWESFLISERIKKLRYSRSLTQLYFWRDYQQHEIDLVELENGRLHAYECKFSVPKKVKFPNSFCKTYPEATTQVIHPENFQEFIL